MERRYLVAALAIVATFATFSSGFRSLQQLSQRNGQRSSTLSRWIAEVKTHLRPAYPEEEQLLAEMNLPIAAAQVRIAEQAVKQSEAAAEIARESATREAERTRREATRMREEMARTERNISIAPLSIDLRGLDNLDQRIQVKTAAMAERVVARSVRMQITAAKWQAVNTRFQESAKHRSPCRSREEMQ